MAKKGNQALELALAKSLYRVAKFDPARNQDEDFSWTAFRAEYLKKADRLIRTFNKDGLQVSFSNAESQQSSE